jgi:vitamin B12 transporter
VVTSDRADATLKNTARTVYVVTRDQIVRNGYRTVAQALADVPAVQISPLGPLGASANFTVRGSSSAQVLVLIDGLPAPGSLSNTVELGNLTTTGVDRIEVVEGGGSTLYGAGAVGGIINIITGRTWQYGATLGEGTFGQRQIDVSLPFVQYSRALAQNAYGLPDGTVRSNNDYQSTAIHLNGERRVGAIDVTLRAGSESDHVGVPGEQAYFSPTSRENDLNQNADATLTHASAQAQQTVQLGGTTQKILFWCAATDPNCFTPAGDLGSEGRLSFGARNAVQGRDEQLLYGVDLSRGVVRQDDGSGNISVDALAQTAAYVQEHVDVRWGSYYGGVRAERDGSLGGQVSPSVGAVVRLSNAFSLKANLANAFRAPNAGELYFPNYGNPNLRAERSDVADLTVASNSVSGVTLGWFGNRTNGLIYSDPVTFALAQAGHALIEGLVLTARTPSYKGFVTSLALTDLYRAADLDTQARLPNDPVISANLRLDYSAGEHGVVDAFGVSTQSRGARSAIVPAAAPLLEQAIPYTNVQAYLRLRAGSRMLLTLRGENLGNERYAAVNGFPLPGRSMLVELSTK